MGYNKDRYDRDQAKKKAGRVRNLNLNPVNQTGAGIHNQVETRLQNKEIKEINDGLLELEESQQETESN